MANSVNPDQTALTRVCMIRVDMVLFLKAIVLEYPRKKYTFWPLKNFRLISHKQVSKDIIYKIIAQKTKHYLRNNCPESKFIPSLNFNHSLV